VRPMIVAPGRARSTLSEAEIPANVRSFLNDQIESVVQVEVLLLLWCGTGSSRLRAGVRGRLP
jgi:hypothetical protein